MKRVFKLLSAKNLFFVFLFVLFVWVAWFVLPPFGPPVMSVAVSTDGRYAISVDNDSTLHLWDLEGRSRTKVSGNANLYSAAFPSRDEFLWQNMDNVVHRQRTDGLVSESFVREPTYGHAGSPDWSVYVSSDQEYFLRVRSGGEVQRMKASGGSFMGFGKVFNLAVSDDGRYLVTAGFGSPHDNDAWPIDEQRELGYEDLVGTVLWSLDTLDPIAKLPGNKAKTHATISPDGRWVVSGDENGNVVVWPTDDPSLDTAILTASYHHGLLDWHSELPRGHPDRWDNSKLIPAPEGATETTIAVKFIYGSRYYLRFGTRSHIAALFEVDNPWPLKYFDLGERPFPATAHYPRNLAIDTAPEAGVLVMGKRDGGGILVYEFDPDALTLERTWVGR